jgi:teichoic acid transport system permease protein
MARSSQRSEPPGLRTQWRRAWSTRQSGAELLSVPLRRELQERYGDLSHLRRVGSRPPLREYFTELWDRRHFIWAGARGAALTRYANERLGALWYILRPILDAAFYGIIFGLVLQVSRGMENFLAWVVVGIFMYQLSSRAITGGVSLIRGSKAMLRAFAFPRASLAVSLTVRELMMAMPAIIVMLVGIIAVPPHEIPTVTWSFFPVILLLHTTLNLGLTLFFGWLGAVLPDLAQAMSFVSRFLMYASAVIFPIDRFIDHPTIMAIIQANPIYIVLQLYRTVLIDGMVPPFADWMTLVAWAFGALLIGFTAFWLDEERYTRD